MGYDLIRLEVSEQVAVLELSQPDRLNAIGTQTTEELIDAVGNVHERGKQVRCLLITGKGRAFSSGGDITETARRGEAPLEFMRNRFHPLLLSLRDLEMPVVTAVGGAAVGVGMSIALMGDIVCASEDAFFLQAFSRVGLVPDGGATFLVPRLVGWGRSLELALLGERIEAVQALEWGLINRLYPDREALMKGATEIARTLARGPKSLGLIRKAHWSTWDNSYEHQLDLELRLQTEASRSEDHSEGVAAFIEKREPCFTGD